MELFFQTETWIAIFTMTILEIVLGIDNIIFISIVSNKLPEQQQNKARYIGLILALGLRILMLIGITWLIGFTQPVFTFFEQAFSGKDIILLAGGLFLIAKSTSEIHQKMESGGHHLDNKGVKVSLVGIILQIVVLDAIFSLDSILTAVGMTTEITIMIIAVVLSLGIMLFFSERISKFINKHPTLQVLALSFLILIGFMLCVESFGTHVSKGYIYFAVSFSLLVEIVNMRVRKKSGKK